MRKEGFLMKLKLKFIFPNEVTVLTSNVSNLEEVEKIVDTFYQKIRTKNSIYVDTFGGVGDSIYVNLNTIEAIMFIHNFDINETISNTIFRILTKTGRKIFIHLDDNLSVEEIIETLFKDKLSIIKDAKGNFIILNSELINSILITKKGS